MGKLDQLDGCDFPTYLVLENWLIHSGPHLMNDSDHWDMDLVFLWRFYDIILCASLVWRSLIHSGESGVGILVVVGWIASVNFISMLIYIWCHFVVWINCSVPEVSQSCMDCLYGFLLSKWWVCLIKSLTFVTSIAFDI